MDNTPITWQETVPNAPHKHRNKSWLIINRQRVGCVYQRIETLDWVADPERHATTSCATEQEAKDVLLAHVVAERMS
jgi:hypothetical protein